MTAQPAPLSENEPLRLYSRLPAMLICVAAILGSGLMTGYLQGRWQPSANLQAIGDRLQDLPAKLGNWELAGEGKLEPQAQKLLQCYGSSVREYSNPTTGDRLNVALLFGPRGPIAVHTPEVCYSSVGTETMGSREAVSISQENETDQFWKVQFRAAQADAPHLEVWYAWSDGGPWHAAKAPRIWFTNHLYKIQIATPPPRNGQPSPAQDFLESLLPYLRHDILSKTPPDGP
jgi:hypothetical protein